MAVCARSQFPRWDTSVYSSKRLRKQLYTLSIWHAQTHTHAEIFGWLSLVLPVLCVLPCLKVSRGNYSQNRSIIRCNARTRARALSPITTRYFRNLMRLVCLFVCFFCLFGASLAVCVSSFSMNSTTAELVLLLPSVVQLLFSSILTWCRVMMVFLVFFTPHWHSAVPFARRSRALFVRALLIYEGDS